MGLPRSLSFLRFGSAPQVLEIYLDPLCPPSGRALRSLASNVIPLITRGGKYEGQLELITRVYAQPFHYLSPYACEALLVFGHDHPDLFLDFFLKAIDIQSQYSNKAAADLRPADVTAAYVAAFLDVLDGAGKLGAGPRSQAHGEWVDKLRVHDKANGGSVAFNDFKYLIKQGRQNGIHVTPTAVFNGYEDATISSSWGEAEWTQWLKEKLE
ncbi:hypothetical protein Q5752_002653 [Cryptotrichosporon argae]